MPFYRFEQMEGKFMTPRLSTAHGPMIEGEFIYFCLVSKEPGAGSVIHYHPNELLIFPIAGKINALVGHTKEASYRFVGRVANLVADVHEEASLDALRKTDASATLAQSGHFMNHQGQELPW